MEKLRWPGRTERVDCIGKPLLKESEFEVFQNPGATRHRLYVMMQSRMPPPSLPHHPLLRGHMGHQGPRALGTRRRNSWHHWCSQSPTTLVSAAGYTLPFLPENVTWRGVPPLSALKIRRSRASSTCICFTGRVLSNTGTDGRSSGRGNLVTRCCNPAHTF